MSEESITFTSSGRKLVRGWRVPVSWRICAGAVEPAYPGARVHPRTRAAHQAAPELQEIGPSVMPPIRRIPGRADGEFNLPTW